MNFGLKKPLHTRVGSNPHHRLLAVLSSPHRVVRHRCTVSSGESKPYAARCAERPARAVPRSKDRSLRDDSGVRNVVLAAPLVKLGRHQEAGVTVARR